MFFREINDVFMQLGRELPSKFASLFRGAVTSVSTNRLFPSFKPHSLFYSGHRSRLPIPQKSTDGYGGLGSYAKWFYYVLGGTFTVGLTQDYLAKNKNDSSLYWRNSPELADMAFQLAHHRYLDRPMSLSRVLSASDFSAQELMRTLHHISSLRRLKRVFDRLDDTIDGSRAADVLMFGDATLGPKLSVFLQKLLNKDDLSELRKFVEEGLITENELFAFGNLFAKKLHIQAELTLLYEREADFERKAQIREQISQQNLDISGAYLALIIHFIKQDKRVLAIVDRDEDNELTYDMLKHIYPVPTKAGELMQIVHDTAEFRYDLRQESVIHKISANYFLAQLEKNGALLASGEEIGKFPDRPVSFHELPGDTQKVFLDIEGNFKRESASLGRITECVYNFSWRYEKAVGFFAEKPRSHNTQDPSVNKEDSRQDVKVSRGG